jgi:hypothetical protein
MKLYHVLSSDSSCRPHELLKLRIKDIVFKVTSDGKQYAQALVTGKDWEQAYPPLEFGSFPKGLAVKWTSSAK